MVSRRLLLRVCFFRFPRSLENKQVKEGRVCYSNAVIVVADLRDHCDCRIVAAAAAAAAADGSDPADSTAVVTIVDVAADLHTVAAVHELMKVYQSALVPSLRHEIAFLEDKKVRRLWALVQICCREEGPA